MLHYNTYCKKRFVVFPSPAGISLTKLSLACNNLIIPGRVEFVSDIQAGDGKIANHFLQCIECKYHGATGKSSFICTLHTAQPVLRQNVA